MWIRRTTLAMACVLCFVILFSLIRWVLPAAAMNLFHKRPAPMTIVQVFAPETSPDTEVKKADPPVSVSISRSAKRSPALGLLNSFENVTFPLVFAGVNYDWKINPPASGMPAGLTAVMPAANSLVVGSRTALGYMTNYYAGRSTLPNVIPVSSAPIPINYRVPQVRITIPPEMTVAASAFITAQIDALNFPISAEMQKPPQVLAVPSAFEIGLPFRPDSTTWKWEVFPKAIGDPRNLTIQYPPEAKLEFSLGGPANPRLEQRGNTVTGHIDIRDELGLTLGQRSLAIAAASLIGLIGTILGYPMVKKRFEPPQPAPLISVAGRGRRP